MALIQSHSSMESFTRWREQSPTGSERRRLSFNPSSKWVPPPPVEDREPVGAFEVSKARRIAQVCVAVVYCLLAAGVVFGFAAIKPVLVQEGVYRDRCTKQELKDAVWVCYEQELRLNLMFTVAAVSTNICALPVGTILDRFGPRIASLIGVLFLSIGALGLAFAADLPFDAYIPGYLFLALGGPFVFISTFQLSNTFPKHSGLILALLTGAFDTSSAVFLVYRLIYQSTGAAFTPKKFFLIYLIVPALTFVAQIFLMPGNSYKTVGELVNQAETLTRSSSSDVPEDIQNPTMQTARREHRESVVSEITTLLGSKSGDEQRKEEEAKHHDSGVWGALHGKSALQQILTPWFILITLFTVVQMTRINYFVATIRTQYTELLHSPSLAAHINSVFDVALPVGGVIAVPFIGLVLDHTSTPFVLALLIVIATAIGALGIVPSVGAAYAHIALFVIYRPLYYTAISDYAGKVFGFATFGTVYGLIICLAGLFNFVQAGLDALTHRAFANDPVPVNVVLMSVTFVVGVALVAFVWRKSYTMQREKLEEEAEGAREVLIPDVGADARGPQTYGTA